VFIPVLRLSFLLERETERKREREKINLFLHKV
jgi:hypothetical protein